MSPGCFFRRASPDLGHLPMMSVHPNNPSQISYPATTWIRVLQFDEVSVQESFHTRNKVSLMLFMMRFSHEPVNKGVRSSSVREVDPYILHAVLRQRRAQVFSRRARIEDQILNLDFYFRQSGMRSKKEALQQRLLPPGRSRNLACLANDQVLLLPPFRVCKTAFRLSRRSSGCGVILEGTFLPEHGKEFFQK